MADELNLDGSIARRAGLLHDIGKAIDHDIEGNHPTIGTNFLKRFSESSIVLNAVAGHHGDILAGQPLHAPRGRGRRHQCLAAGRPKGNAGTLHQAAGEARRSGHQLHGVETAYAIQAGREIRVIVDANKVDDEAAMKVARDIAKKVEDEMTYPGEIQVTLLREVRCVEYAK